MGYHTGISFVFKISQSCTFVAISTFLSHVGQVEGATINAKSVSFGDVRSAVASAKDSDQIRNDPPVNQRTGTAAWPTQQRDLIYVLEQHISAGS